MIVVTTAIVLQKLASDRRNTINHNEPISDRAMWHGLTPMGTCFELAPLKAYNG